MIYKVEVVHELSGAHMSFDFESDTDKDQVWNEILQDISITVYEED